MEKLLLNVKEVSILLGLSVRTVWKHASSGIIPKPIHIGGAVKWRRVSIEDFIEEQEQIIRRKERAS